MSGNDQKALQATIPVDLHRQIKAAAAREGLSIREWMLEAALARLRLEGPQPAGE